MDILVFCDFYLPGFKAGGPIKSISSFVERMGDLLSIGVVTRDRDAGDWAAYPGIVPNHWLSVGKARVLYLSPDRWGFEGIRDVLRSTPHRALYLNSFFSPVFTLRPLLLRRLGLVKTLRIVLAPRGELSARATRIKRIRKGLYLRLSAYLRMYDGLIWQVSSDYEARDLERAASRMGLKGGRQPTTVIAPDLPARRHISDRGAAIRHTKQKGSLRIVFLSRIVPIKNLDVVLATLAAARVRTSLDIYGPLEDEAYWSTCREQISSLPEHVTVAYHGQVHPTEVVDVLERYELFFLPSQSENFGHAILEAMVAGCPVLISDQTAFRDLERAKAGWDLPLDSVQPFVAAIERCAAMEAEEHSQWSEGAIRLAHQYTEDPTLMTNYARLFSAEGRA